MNTIVNTQLFDMDEAQKSAGWIAELDKPYHTPETEEYGVGSFVYSNDERPFHPERLAKIMHSFGTSLVDDISRKAGEAKTNDVDNKAEIFANVIRCKGELWLLNADACPIDIHSVGRQLVLEPAGRPWIGKVVESHPNGDSEGDNPNDEDCAAWEAAELNSDTLEQLKVANKWNDTYGDRRSEIVFIGIKLNENEVRRALNDALMTFEELNVNEADRERVWAKDVEDSFFDDMPLWHWKILWEKKKEKKWKWRTRMKCVTSNKKSDMCVI